MSNDATLCLVCRTTSFSETLPSDFKPEEKGTEGKTNTEMHQVKKGKLISAHPALNIIKQH